MGLSKGPSTAEGKSRSSKNVLKHGFAASITSSSKLKTSPNSNHAKKWSRIHARTKPASTGPYFEIQLVDQLAAISWRQNRLVAAETALIDDQIGAQAHAIAQQHPVCCEDLYFHLAKAFEALSRQPMPEKNKEDEQPPPEAGQAIGTLELVRRYQVSLDRQFRNTLLDLRQYRKDFAAAAVVTSQEEQPPRLPEEPAEPNEPNVAQSSPPLKREPIPFPQPQTSRPDSTTQELRDNTHEASLLLPQDSARERTSSQ